MLSSPRGEGSLMCVVVSLRNMQREKYVKLLLLLCCNGGRGRLRALLSKKFLLAAALTHAAVRALVALALILSLSLSPRRRKTHTQGGEPRPDRSASAVASQNCAPAAGRRLLLALAAAAAAALLLLLLLLLRAELVVLRRPHDRLARLLRFCFWLRALSV